MTAQDTPGIDRLTDAEREVLRLAWHGLSNQQIARLRHSREDTVKNQLNSAYARLGLGRHTQKRACAAALLFVHEHPARAAA